MTSAGTDRSRTGLRRVALVASLALIVTAGSVAAGGIPFALALAVILVLVVAALPASPRRFLFKRAGRVVGSVAMAMAVVWLLVHNYPDASRSDETGLFPAMARYIDWIGGLVAGEMGPSQYSETVGEGISRTLPISLQLVAYSQVIALAIAVPGALLGARLRGRMGDVAARSVGLLGLSLPVFITAPVVIQLLGLGGIPVFGFQIGGKLLPVVRYVPVGDGLGSHLASMFMPSLTLALSTAAVYLVLLRAELIGQLQSDHVLLARSKGLSPRRIVRAHALRPASPTALAAVAAQTGGVLGNMIIVERLFTLPGFGDYTLVAIGRRDVLAVAGALFVAALIVAVVNLVADALLLVLDPRL